MGLAHLEVRVLPFASLSYQILIFGDRDNQLDRSPMALILCPGHQVAVHISVDNIDRLKVPHHRDLVAPSNMTTRNAELEVVHRDTP